MDENSFQQRFIAFVEILGFSSIVERMSSEGHLFSTVRDALIDLDRQSRTFHRYGGDLRKRREATLYKGRTSPRRDTELQTTAFSECYVLSGTSSPWHVLAAVQALGSRFLGEGIFTRGAVVQGYAYHDGRALFGPGILDAYKLESEVAKHPRILVTEPVRQLVWDFHKGLWKGRLLDRDVDGCWFVNILFPSLSSWAQLSGPAIEPDTHAHLNRVRQSLINEWQRAQGNVAHMSKLRWLVQRFNKAAVKDGVDKIDRSANK